MLLNWLLKRRDPFHSGTLDKWLTTDRWEKGSTVKKLISDSTLSSVDLFSVRSFRSLESASYLFESFVYSKYYSERNRTKVYKEVELLNFAVAYWVQARKRAVELVDHHEEDQLMCTMRQLKFEMSYMEEQRTGR